MTDIRHDTLTLRRRLSHAPSAVFAAFADPQARAIWAPPSPDMNMRYTEASFEVGGRDLCVCGTGPAEGVTVDTLYHVIETDARILFSEAIGMPGTPEAVSLVTVTMTPTDSGTTLSVVIQIADLSGGSMIPEVKGGWTASLGNLETYLDGQSTG